VRLIMRLHLLSTKSKFFGCSGIPRTANTSDACLIAPAARQTEDMGFGEGA
jgi:hypothetical protein